MAANDKLPRWSLDSIYQGFDSKEYIADKAALPGAGKAVAAHAALAPAARDWKAWLLKALSLRDEAIGLASNLGSYCYARYSTATTDARALAELNAAEEAALPWKNAEVQLAAAVASRAEETRAAAKSAELGPYAFLLEEMVVRAAHYMSPELEDLASDLQRSGGDAWGRLQEQVSSMLSADWGDGTRKTVIELRNLAYDKDRAAREKAFRLELAAWKSVEIPVAAALNGVKGTTVALCKRRNWKDALEKSAFQSRVAPRTLEALIAALEGSLPAFRRYLGAKAKALGLPKCDFFDLFAPLPAAGKEWSWKETEDYIVARFSEFDAGFGDYARTAFRSGWIDAEPRAGKVGGAYCTSFDKSGEERVLCNFNGDFGALTTVAHELGHAWHSRLLAEKPVSLRGYPMTLAETASIFAETVVFESAAAAAAPAERAALLELNIQDSCQVIVDILSRFYFEKRLFAERASRELSPAELCRFMEEAQRATYGDALGEIHPYMWAVKGHYYSPDLAFYNFPYAFGLLFALGLYAKRGEEGPGFSAKYRDILLATGAESAESVTARAGFDIGTVEFWEAGIGVVEARIGEFAKLAAER